MALSRSARSASVMGEAAKRILEILVIAIWFFPLVWMVITSLKPESEVVTRNFAFWPRHPSIVNYSKAFSSTGILKWLLNSLYISAFSMVLTLLVDAPIAYAFAKIKFKSKNVLFWMVMGAMMVPFQVLIVPLYLQFNRFGLLDTLTVAALPRIALPIGIFILKQFYEGIPDALEEAAFTDGASRYLTFAKIILPLGKAAATTVVILSFINAWNDFLWPLIAINQSIKYPVTVGIANFQGTHGTEYALMMAGAVVASLPQLVFFLVFRKRIIEGIASQGIKG